MITTIRTESERHVRAIKVLLADDHHLVREALKTLIEEQGRFEVVVKGGREPTGIDAIEWARRGEELGAGEILLTSMDRDGTKDGFDIPLTRAVSDAVGIPVIASGGAGTTDHCVEAVEKGHADAVLAASIFHRREIEISTVKADMAAAGIPVRRTA